VNQAPGLPPPRVRSCRTARAAGRAKIVAAFPKVNVTGVPGKIAFDPHGDVIKPPFTLFEVRQGQWKSQRIVDGLVLYLYEA